MVVSLTLAAVTTAVRGSPPPSQTRWSLLPGLPRSTGFAPTWSPALGPHAHGVHARPLPVQLALLAQAVQDLQVELLEDASVGPLGQPAPAGRRRTAAELAGGQQPPGGGGPGHVHDRGQAGPIRDGAVPAAVRWARRDRQQGLDDRPQLVRYEVVSKDRHGPGSCQINPKGSETTSKAGDRSPSTPRRSGQQIGQPQSRSAGLPPERYHRRVRSAGERRSTPRQMNAYQWAD
jgi:hypothetical protein